MNRVKKMQDIEIKNLLANAGAVPKCPSDKFVAAFHAQMDMDSQMPIKPARAYWGYGAIAASLVIAFGVYLAVQNQIQLPFNNGQANIETASINSNPADEFAAELIADVYIEEVARTNEL